MKHNNYYLVKLNDERKKQLDERWETLPKPYRVGAEQFLEKYALIGSLPELVYEYKEVAEKKAELEARDRSKWTPSDYNEAYKLSHNALAIKRRANILGYDIEEDSDGE